jgi:hypothetical protein
MFLSAPSFPAVNFGYWHISHWVSTEMSELQRSFLFLFCHTWWDLSSVIKRRVVRRKAFSSTMKTEVKFSSESSVCFLQTTWRNQNSSQPPLLESQVFHNLCKSQECGKHSFLFIYIILFVSIFIRIIIYVSINIFMVFSRVIFPFNNQP